ncbi:hypothetical protein DL766_004119 [Monosporascus sp. MC13-8B]|uniref:Haloacid dehalogenase-like hydrolase n=1 Tax=Monosporascus cannonballus TaxID=155416 RepID=A0ABY0HIB2_9PEZI|nr:hypothetical protein DL762_000812 [Monosporascus cannonballus]RYO96369.1 hypothetical protein DL763_003225 [Monosporascus cannonballus]RYP32112.1 hypothetical protein DL766_004119 [Monosporascus sp. MC13-8B]
MFGEMRAALGGIPKSTDILEHIYGLPTPEEREAAFEAVRAVERRAMAAQRPQPGLAELMRHLDARGVRKAICTRNFDAPVAHLLSRFLPGSAFDPVVTRDFRPPKPHPAGILFIAHSWGLARRLDRGRGPGSGFDEGGGEAGNADQQQQRDQAMRTEELVKAAQQGTEAETRGALGPAEHDGDGDGRGEQVEEVGDASALIMVGDSLDDMTAGRRAGAATVLLVNDENRHLAEHPDTDLVISRLDELIGVLEEGFVGRDITEST